VNRYEIEIYLTEKGKAPFQDWLDKIKDKTAQTKIYARKKRASFGNFKSIQGAEGLFEMREHYSSGYRIYYSIIGNKMVLMLAGSTKKDQDRAINKPKEYLKDYERSNNHD